MAEWITRQEAAGILGVSVSGIRKWAREGQIRESKEVDGSVVVSALDVARLEKERPGVEVRGFLDLYSKRNAALDDLRVVIEEQRREAARKDARISELETRMAVVHEREAKILREMEELASFAHERELEVRKAAHSEQIKNRAMERLGPLANAIAVKVGGPGFAGLLGPGGGTVVKTAIEDLRADFSPDQVDKILPHLTQRQALALQTLLDSVGEDVQTSARKGE